MLTIALIACAPIDAADAYDSASDTGFDAAWDTAYEPSLALPELTGAYGSGSPSTGALRFHGERPKNVLLIGIDTLRRDMIGAYAAAEDTPTLTRMLEGGVRLDDHRSCANWTYPSLVCVSSGASVEEQGFGGSEETVFPGPTDGFLASRLADAGATTRYLGATPFMDPAYRLTEGFDQATNDADWNAERVVDHALDAIDELEADEDPWFLQLHFLDAHLPYQAPDAYLPDIDFASLPIDLTTASGMSKLRAEWDTLSRPEQQDCLEAAMALYRSEIQFLDDELGRLVEYLEETGTLDDTLVVLFSDHGEQFWEHGEMGHKDTLYAQETRTLGGFFGGGLMPGVVDSPTTHADLAPSIFAALGLDAPEQTTGHVVGTAPDDRIRFTLRSNTVPVWQAAERDGGRVVVTWTGRIEYYRTDVDPDELHDLYEPGIDDTDALLDALEIRASLLEGLVDGSPDFR